jgi:hypothetical protein
MYEMVTLDTSIKLKRFLVACRARPPEFFAKHVKTLCLRDELAGDLHYPPILSVCTGVVNLACWSGTAHVRGSHILRRLSIDLDLLMSLSNSLSFPNVTHLNIIEIWPTVAEDFVGVFPSLTHIALYTGIEYNGPRNIDTIPRLLEQCASLQVLIVLFDKACEKDYGPSPNMVRQFYSYYVPVVLTDPRVVFAETPDVEQDWEASVRGQDDMWVGAEKIVQWRKESLEQWKP